MPLLIVFGGLPGTGKTKLARGLARRLAATHLRFDTIAQSLKAAGLAVRPTGYVIANALAADNLRLDRTVIADCVNPVLASRIGWRETALRCRARPVEIEIVCSDPAEHRRRVEDRVADIEGLILPNWDEITSKPYEPWDQNPLVLDAAGTSIDRLVEVGLRCPQDGAQRLARLISHSEVSTKFFGKFSSGARAGCTRSLRNCSVIVLSVRPSGSPKAQVRSLH